MNERTSPARARASGHSSCSIFTKIGSNSAASGASSGLSGKSFVSAPIIVVAWPRTEPEEDERRSFAVVIIAILCSIVYFFTKRQQNSAVNSPV